MANQAPGFMVPGLTAAADLSGQQYRAVRVTGDFAVNVANAAGQAVIGVLQNKPTSGQPAEVMSMGVTKVLAGAAIAAGAEVMAGADGRIITAATAGSNVIGICMEAAANANEIVTVLLGGPSAIV